MQPIARIPTYSICNLMGSDRCSTEIVVRRLGDYMRDMGDIEFPHRHDFYQIVLFTQGSGSHSIDFQQWPVAPHQVYYMAPGQMHTWQFGADTDGYIINFHASLYGSICQDADFAQQFPVFSQSLAEQPVNLLDLSCCSDVEQTFAQLLREYDAQMPFKMHILRGLLLVILVKLSRALPSLRTEAAATHQVKVVRDFERLIDAHFREKHMPKEYAALLHITPNYLNALTTVVTGKKAGELIRDRRLLEAKRLLVNTDTQSNQIADDLGFEDNSYFARFFRKNTGVTPERFRKSATEGN